MVCPGAPLLIPGLADDLSAQLPGLVDACDRAVGMLAAVDRVLLLCSGPRARDGGLRAAETSVVHPAGTVVTSALITGRSGSVHFTGRLPGAPAATADDLPPAGVGTVVGAALLARAGIAVPVTAVDLADATAEVCALSSEVQASADRVGLLVVAEGSAGRGATSPAGGSADAEVLDASLAAALAAGDPSALAAAAGIDRERAVRLLFTSGPSLTAMAELTANRPPDRAELLMDEGALGVGYLVAAWSWSGRARR